MGTYKVLFIVFLMVLSFYIRGSKSRSLKDDEVLSNSSDKQRDLRDLNTQECACFPYNKSGIAVSKYLSPEGEQQERLVVYFYKGNGSKNFTVFIPSVEKQRILPDLTFDIGDKLEAIAPEKVIDLFRNNYAYFTKVEEGIDVSSALTVPEEEFSITSTGTDAPDPDSEIPKTFQTDDQVVSSVNTNQYPIQPTPVFINHPDTSHETGPDMKPNLKLNRPVEIIHRTLTGAAAENNQMFSWPLDNHLFLYDNVNSYILPEKIDATVLTTSPEDPGQLTPSNKPLQKLNSPLGQQNQSIEIPPKDLNVSTYNPLDLGETAAKYILPEYIGSLPSSVSPDVISSWIDMSGSNVPANLESHNGHLPKKYELTTFNEWFSKQFKSIEKHLNRPSMSNVIDFHSLRLILLKALYENGMYLSGNGELYDSRRNIIKITNLKLRPILLGDPLEYEQLIASNKYELSYLEAILVTLDYPPLILAIIPVGNVLSTKSYENASPLEDNKKMLDKSKRKTYNDFSRTNEPSDKTYTNDYLKNLHSKEIRSGQTVEENETILSNDQKKASKNDIAVGTHSPFDVSPESNLDNWRYLISSLTPNDQSKYGEEFFYLQEGNYLEERQSTEDSPHTDAKQPDEEDNELLTIRIVGGNPATSSGTPVSSKGRSGFDA